jgi:hypothetical protein
MNLSPLRDGEADDFELSLLRSADADGPPLAALGRAAATLGVSTTLLASVAKEAAAAGAQAAAGASGGTAAVAGTSGLAKTFIVGALAGLVTAGGGGYAWRSANSAPTVPAALVGTSPSPPNVLVQAVGPAPGNEDQAAVPTMTATTIAEPSRATQRPLPSAAPASGTDQASTLAAEVASLDRVRSALRTRQPALARSELGKYRSAFPRGSLGLEASVLEVEAVAASGDRAAAARLADALLAQNPGARYRARLEPHASASSQRF